MSEIYHYCTVSSVRCTNGGTVNEAARRQPVPAVSWQSHTGWEFHVASSEKSRVCVQLANSPPPSPSDHLPTRLKTRYQDREFPHSKASEHGVHSQWWPRQHGLRRLRGLVDSQSNARGNTVPRQPLILLYPPLSPPCPSLPLFPLNLHRCGST